MIEVRIPPHVLRPNAYHPVTMANIMNMALKQAGIPVTGKLFVENVTHGELTCWPESDEDLDADQVTHCYRWKADNTDVRPPGGKTQKTKLQCGAYKIVSGRHFDEDDEL
jgi:hypothetical protein